MNEQASYDLASLAPAPPARPRLGVFMESAVLLGSEFLACGGPVTRLEAQLSLAGKRHGYDTDVHATPSAITIYCNSREQHESGGRGGRIPNFGIDLGRLSLIDKTLSQFACGEIQCAQVNRKLQKLKWKKPTSVFTVPHFINTFGIGVGVALLGGAGTLDSVKCGLFSVVVRLAVFAGSKFFNSNPIFTDFLACFVAFLAAAGAQDFLGVPAAMLSLGTLIYVVPGLLMTTAISEIVDQNYLSGAIRLLKALSTFMAMALAYFLAMDLGRLAGFNLQNTPTPPTALPHFWVRILGSAMILLCSAIEFRAHRKLIFGILLCGLSGAVCYICTQSPNNLVAPHFLSAFVIGLLSYVFSRRYKHPSQIYSVPSVLILAPGMLAFSSFGYGVGEQLALPSIVRAVLISLSIVFGLAASRLPFRTTSG